MMNNEKRSRQRHQVNRRVRFTYNFEQNTQRCTLYDVSDTGAMIGCADPDWVPGNFRLYDDLLGYSIDCEIVRSSGNCIGVKFVGPSILQNFKHQTPPVLADA